MLTVLAITIVVLAGAYLLALVSDGFGYALSRAVEAAFESAELRAAERSARRRPARASAETVAYEASYSHAR
jgi:hypothetical protein